MSNSRLDNPAIRAALEANRAKISLMQQEQAAGSRGVLGYRTAAPSELPASDGADRSASMQARHGLDATLRSNPVYGDDSASTPTARGIGDDYAPKSFGAMRSAPLAGLPIDSGLPPVGDLFSPQPRLPLSVRLATQSFSPATAPGPAPSFAPWDVSRPFLAGTFLLGDAPAPAPGQALESYPPRVQESLLVDDLLHAFDGLSGTWVRAKLVEGRGGPRLEYRIAARGQLEPALMEMASRMLPLCECVAVVQRYVETRRGYEWGLVCQALAGAMRQVVQDWQLMLAQLEHQLKAGKLTMQALWYYVQPPMAAMRLVATIAADASFKQARGAALLNLLHAKAAGLLGDAAAHRLALRLLRAAAEPYFAMLERWLCEGVVDDPYGEFMVQEDGAISNADLSADGGSAFWAEKFMLRIALDPGTGAPLLPDASGATVHDVPVFLAKSKAAILNTGKYLNLVRSCGRQPQRPLPLGMHLEYDEGGRYSLHLEEAHRAAASEAMALLRHEVGVSRGLATLKRYFLAAQGDLFLGFMDSGEEELNSRVGLVPLDQLQAVLDIAVRSSSAAADPSAVRLRAAYDHRSVLSMLIAITQTSGAGDSPQKRPKMRPVVPMPMSASEKATVGRQKLARESFMLSYEAPWPLSIVAPDAALAQYQMAFRHLFELNWVERELSKVCGLYHTTAALANVQRRARRRDSLAAAGPAAAAAAAMAASTSPAAATLAVAYHTAQIMTHFFRQYLLYATFEVLEPLWASLERHIESAATVDDIIDYHRVFLKKVMKGLLLSRNVVVLRALLALKDLALTFVKHSSTHLTIDYEGIDQEMSEAAAVAGTKGPAVQRDRRKNKGQRIRAFLEEALSSPSFAGPVREYRSKFEARCGDFMCALADAHKQARSEKSDTREELESLQSLMGRLDFNGYFAKRVAGVGAAMDGAGGGLVT